jgi:dienelactone hydrolase
MRILATLLVISASLPLIAQNFPIGTRNITFFDASRNRNIPSVVHYPAVSGGTDTPVAAGEHPVLVFGHGFVMGVGAYDNFRDHFVPKGFILVLPTTEGSFSPSHGNFGQDLAFLAEAMQDANDDPASPFHQRVLPATALMGHSMGGGASVLGASNNSSIQTLVNFAAAETNPSAVAAASAVSVPTLMFAGGNDCVTPVPQHQQPIYTGIGAACKAFVSITGGGHCHFANFNLACSTGEATCSPAPTITREQQQDVVNDIALLWLNAHLRNDQPAFAQFMDSVAMSSRVQAQTTCMITGLTDAAAPSFEVHPVPASQQVVVSGLVPGSRIRIHDASGRELPGSTATGSTLVLDVAAYPAGIYRLAVEAEGIRQVRSFVVLH